MSRPAPPPPPWIKARAVRGRFSLEAFGNISLGQKGGIEYLGHGGGLGIDLGIELGRWFSTGLKYTGSLHNPITGCVSGFFYAWCDTNYLAVQTVAGTARGYIPTRTRVVPFAEIDGVLAWIGRGNHLSDAFGGGLEAGGGVDIWVSQTGTIGVLAMYRRLWMKEYDGYTGTGTELSGLRISLQASARF